MGENGRTGVVIPKQTKAFSNFYPLFIGKLPPLSKVATRTAHYHIVLVVPPAVVLSVKVIGEPVLICVIHCPVNWGAAVVAFCGSGELYELLIAYLKPQSV